MSRVSKLLENNSILDKVEKKFNVKLKNGRNEIKGLPFDMGMVMNGVRMYITAVDKDAAKDLAKLFTSRGFFAKIDNKDKKEVMIQQWS